MLVMVGDVASGIGATLESRSLCVGQVEHYFGDIKGPRSKTYVLRRIDARNVKYVTECFLGSYNSLST